MIGLRTLLIAGGTVVASLGALATLIGAPRGGAEPAPPHGAQPHAPQRRAPTAEADPAAGTHRFVGSASCAASNCHGGAHPGGPRGDEYSIWIQSDPHARAGSVLSNAESRRIGAQLGITAHESRRCLACHATGTGSDASAPSILLAEGVGCESCHGPAEHWLEPHKRTDWKLVGSAKRAQLGFLDTKRNLAERSRACAGCHVGGRDRDVNHDLFAAGHPRLDFEMAAYDSLLPAHWSRADDRRRHGALEAKLWAVGRVVSAEAALELLSFRARPEAASVEPPPWPEFSEYGCFACHHELRVPNWRQDIAVAGRPGRLPWGTWQFSLLETLSGNTGGPDIAVPRDELRELLARPRPDRAAVVAASNRLRDACRKWADALASRPIAAPELDALSRTLTDRKSVSTWREWDEFAQAFLGVVALRRSRFLLEPHPEAAATAKIQVELVRVRDALRFAEGPGGRGMSPRRDDAPARDDLRELFQNLHDALEAKPGNAP